MWIALSNWILKNTPGSGWGIMKVAQKMQNVVLQYAVSIKVVSIKLKAAEKMVQYDVSKGVVPFP